MNKDVRFSIKALLWTLAIVYIGIYLYIQLIPTILRLMDLE